jgi:UDP-galactopyranose mutase
MKSQFRSFFQAGFECSTHQYLRGNSCSRVDVLEGSRHDVLAQKDYELVARYGMSTIRDGVRWHLIEKSPRQYDFSSWLPMLEAAQQAGVEVIWDLLHFGWPEHVDVFTPEFSKRFGEFAFEAGRILRAEQGNTGYVVPVNEISFMAWGGGDEGFLFPHARGRGHELKRQLVSASIAAMEALKQAIPGVKFVHAEPAIHVVAHPDRPHEAEQCRAYSNSMFQAWDMLSGRLCPELGGKLEYLDVLGINYYERNQWIHNGGHILPGHPLYRPFGQIIQDIYQRYAKPVFVAETGTENEARPEWFRYICGEVRGAMERGVPVQGICLYPVVNHPGWEDCRHCHNGLFDYADEAGEREAYQPLADELKKQQEMFMSATLGRNQGEDTYDLVCLSHLRWGFVFQRPQHLMSRFAMNRRVVFFEEPYFHDGPAYLNAQICPNTGVQVLIPHLPHGLNESQVNQQLNSMLRQFLTDHQFNNYVLWYYTPMALKFSEGLNPVATVYDCMDELSAFKGAPPELRELEEELMRRADAMFTGGMSLYEVKANRHPNVHPFPSGVDVAHFKQARTTNVEPADQASIPHPRFGFAGVVDERFDIELVRGVAEMRPDWHIVVIGPVVKIDPESLPKAPNIHYLGGKDYKELPAYLSGWDVGVLWFARNESTRFISPTKTPEYLAAGKPVVSTSIRDVVRPYQDLGLVQIADDPQDFVDAGEKALVWEETHPAWLKAADEFLLTKSWDAIWSSMNALIEEVIAKRNQGVGATDGEFTNNEVLMNKGAQECSII